MSMTKLPGSEPMTVERLNFEATQLLRKSGTANPARLLRLIRNAISFLEIDLSGLTVLTEAASGSFVVTPVIAAMAGAERVIALTRDSPYATAKEVIAQTEALESICCPGKGIEIHTQRSSALFAQADVVTNLGFVRPIDNQVVAAMKSTAAVPLMCEAWELRAGDVDVEACQKRGILVLGTNEDYPGLEVFAYSGWLCLKMLFGAGIEIHKSRILIVSSDKFGRVINELLVRVGVEVQLVPHLREIAGEFLTTVEAVVVADYTRPELIIGPGGDVSAEHFAEIARGATVIQFAGQVDVQRLVDNGINVYPGVNLIGRRMARTLADLGPRPVVDLHAAGLKVGELGVRNPAGVPAMLKDTKSLLQSVQVRHC